MTRQSLREPVRCANILGMMRKNVKIIMILLLAAVLLPAAVFAEPSSDGCTADPEGKHAWTREVTKESTCTEAGTAHYLCSRCGAEYEEEIPAAHKPKTVRGWAATCTEAGCTDGQVCSVCGKTLVYQRTISALGHNYKISGSVEHECTESGQVVYTCTRCKDSYTNDVPDSWHTWDDGKVTQEPEGFVPGVFTYTCTRFSNHTKEQEINPGPKLFRTVRGIPEGADKDAELTVAKQPESGRVEQVSGSSYTFEVKAEGGTAPYTYEWFSSPMTNGKAAEASDARKRMEALFDDLYWYHNTGIKAQADMLWGLYKDVEGMTPTDLPAEQIRKARTTLDRLEPTVRPEGAGDSGKLTASEAERVYYCVITDAAGRKVKTETAQLRYELHVAVQPHNESLYGKDSVTISCEGGGGAKGPDPESYSYAWYDYKNNPVSGGTNRDLTVKDPGDFYCVISDGDKTVKTKTVTVYKEEPLAPESASSSMAVRSLEGIRLTAGFKGGAAPYYVEWIRDGEVIEAKKSGRANFTLKPEDFGKYVCAVTDAMGNTACCEIYLYVKTFTFTEQPAGGTLAKGGKIVLKVSISDGNQPYSYYLYRNGELSGQAEENVSRSSASFTVDQGGEYQIVIVDSTGVRGYSNSVTVNDYQKMFINNYTDEAGMGTDGSPAALLVRVNGGKAPYTFAWEKRVTGKYGWPSDPEPVKTETVNEIYNYLMATDPDTGVWYSCRVTDADGNTAYASSMRAVYRGAAPYFTKHPEDTVLKSEEDEAAPQLRAWAVTGKGSEQTLQYVWQRLEGGRWLYCGSGYWLSLEDAIPGRYRCAASADGFATVIYSNSCEVTRTAEEEQ